MKFSEAWLREYYSPGVDTEGLAAALTRAGLEVDAVEPVAPEFQGVIVGEIVGCGPHPDADRLQVCTVAGAEEPVQVVCGAPNARAGLKVPFATVGAALPGDFKIKRAKLRGVESLGMLCSAKELGLSDDATGLLELPADAPAGADLRDYLGLDDHSIDVDLTPNRSDCLGLRGLAIDLSASLGEDFAWPAAPEIPGEHSDELPIELRHAEGCPRYLGRIIRGIDPGAQTPIVLQEKLRRSGIRPIHPVVDVTNLVMLELGQPMHGFDLAQIEGGIVVRQAQAGESLVLLDGREIALSEDLLLIADHAKPLALAGIMGGEHSGVGPDTTDVYLESAWFNPAAIIGKARRLGMHTDASHRFERGVDPQLQRAAMERATELLLQIAGGSAGPVTEACVDSALPASPQIELRAARLSQLLGLDLPATQVGAILRRLGCQLSEVEGGWKVTPPSARLDLQQEIDLIEEVARIHGYENLPSRVPQGAIPPVQLPESQISERAVRARMVARGYFEAVTWSFGAEAALAPMGESALPLANPLSQDLSHMRTAITPGLLGALVRNQARQHARVRLFEIGTVFRPEAETFETKRLAALVTGPATPESWADPQRAVDFYDIKGDLQSVLGLAADDMVLRRGDRDWLHPGRSADIYLGDTCVGWVGALHPQWLASADARGEVYGFEIDFAAAFSAPLPRATPVSRFPGVRRDLALIVADSTDWGQIRSIVEEMSGNLLTELRLFDQYRGPGVADGYKSLALALTFRHLERTLQDDEVEALMASLTNALSERLGAKLRD